MKSYYIYIVHADFDENNVYSEFDDEATAIEYAKNHIEDGAYVVKVEVFEDQNGFIEEGDSECIWNYADVEESLTEEGPGNENPDEWKADILDAEGDAWAEEQELARSIEWDDEFDDMSDLEFAEKLEAAKAAKAEKLDELYDDPRPAEAEDGYPEPENAVVSCDADITLVAHSEDEKPLDCKMEEEPLEKPLTEEDDLDEATHAQYAKPEGNKITSYNNALKYAKEAGVPFIYGYTSLGGDGKFFALDQPIKATNIIQAEKDFRSRYKNCNIVYVAYPDKDFVESVEEENPFELDF